MHTNNPNSILVPTRVIHAVMLAMPDCPHIDQIFDPSRRNRIARSAKLLPEVITPLNFTFLQEKAMQAEVLFGCWGFPYELLEDPARFSRLRAIFYSGGSVKGFARPLMERGVHLVSARRANAVSVAQFCLGQIILSCKGYFRNTLLCRDRHRPRERAFTGLGLYGETIALLGMGAVAREMAVLLRSFNLKVLAVDPYLGQEEAEKLGVRIVSMKEAFAEAYVISNHLPDLPSLQNVLGAQLFSSMRPDATFLNTGRGAQVNEDDLAEVARRRPDLVFLLDVTCEEPPLQESPLYDLPNVQLSSHIAGAFRDEIKRLGDAVIEDFERYARGEPLHFAEQLSQLSLLG